MEQERSTSLLDITGQFVVPTTGKDEDALDERIRLKLFKVQSDKRFCN